jgi:predicted enzyme related to lactoylglutathione lyase
VAGVQEREGFPPGVPCWIDTQQPDRDAALRFYGAVFGWSFENHLQRGDRAYDLATVDGRVVAAIGSGPSDTTATWTTYIGVDDVEAAVANVEAAGGTVVAPPLRAGSAGRLALVTDPTGANLALWEPGRRKGVERVNEPGSWNWSLLSTPDPAGAAAFYAEVFGWETDLDAPGPKLVRLPGYADFLEQFDPELRARHAAGGVPEGFSDAVAWILPSRGAAFWAVTFSVADADAAAQAAEQEGGRVVSGPTDTEWTREVVLADPAGATFTASAFRPPS